MPYNQSYVVSDLQAIYHTLLKVRTVQNAVVSRFIKDAAKQLNRSIDWLSNVMSSNTLKFGWKLFTRVKLIRNLTVKEFKKCSVVTKIECLVFREMGHNSAGHFLSSLIRQYTLPGCCIACLLVTVNVHQRVIVIAGIKHMFHHTVSD